MLAEKERTYVERVHSHYFASPSGHLAPLHLSRRVQSTAWALSLVRSRVFSVRRTPKGDSWDRQRRTYTIVKGVAVAVGGRQPADGLGGGDNALATGNGVSGDGDKHSNGANGTGRASMNGDQASGGTRVGVGAEESASDAGAARVEAQQSAGAGAAGAAGDGKGGVEGGGGGQASDTPLWLLMVPLADMVNHTFAPNSAFGLTASGDRWVLSGLRNGVRGCWVRAERPFGCAAC